MDALLIVDMQAGIHLGPPKHDLAAVVLRIDALAQRVRNRGGAVVFVQHDGNPGEDFAPHTPGWQLLEDIGRDPTDLVSHKTLNSAFAGTRLEQELRRLGVSRALICGWATDQCVDCTVHGAIEAGLEVVVVADAHTVSDRLHLSASQVIVHHHWVWTQLFAPGGLRLMPAAEC